MSQLLDRIAALPPSKRTALFDMLRPAPEPIAIVGMGCRFPGADSPASFWDLLEHGRDQVIEVPKDRWDVDAHYDPDPNAAGRVASRWGTYVDNVDRFDAHFFGIGAHEAGRMDPHQRVLLEVAWEALESGNISPTRLARTSTGVFIGAYHSDFSQLALSDPERIDLYTGTGTSNNVLAGRLSYTFDLRGPSIVVDTACSSGLVAVQLACQSLRNRECDTALAGGVTLLLTPLSFVMASRMGLMARDGRCKTFDARADGIVMGDGCGVVVLKRLSDAQTAGDTILAIIRGAAVNQDGRTNGITAPNVLSQQALLRAALLDASVDAATVTCLEAHGTGTPLGDPIEIEALTHVFGQPRPQGNRCAIGSVKTNIGHTGAAAGLAGLIKVVLSLQNQRIPPHLNFRDLSPNISLEDTPFFIPLQPEHWSPAESLKRAGVSAFGWSGTNAHVIVEEAPIPDPSPETAAQLRHLLLLSATKASALDALADRYVQHINAAPSVSPADLCHTAAVGRAHLPHRLAVEGASLEQLRDRLTRFRFGDRTPGIWTGEARSRRPSPAFLFTGQGSQRIGMGQHLYRTQSTFREELDRCDAILKPLLDRSIVAVMHGEVDGASLDDTAWAQPALVALEWSLYTVWRSWGVTPAAVMGHSVGEIAAACVAGVFELEDALSLAAARGRLVSALPRGGAMAAVFAPIDKIISVVALHPQRLALAALNGPDETVLSGRADALQTALEALAAMGIGTRPLAVSHAFHSPLMDPALDELERVAASLHYASPRIPLVSSLTGLPVEPGEITTPSYWRRQLREPVRFADGIRDLRKRGHDVFLEIGPTPTLSAMARRCAPEGTELYLVSLDRDKDDLEQMLSAAGALYAYGGDLEGSALEAAGSTRRTPLPTYPFQRDHYPVPVMKSTPRPATTIQHLKSTRVRSPQLHDAVFEYRISTDTLPYLQDHRLYGAQVLPMTGYVEMALSAANDALGTGRDTLSSLLIAEPMLIGVGEERIAQVLIHTEPAGGTSFEVHSRLTDGSAWTRHLTGHIVHNENQPPHRVDLEALNLRCPEVVPVDGFYRWLADQGLDYGETFRGLRAITRGEGEAIATVRLPDSLAKDAQHYRAHPALLDACDQVFAAALPGAATLIAGSDIYLPLSVERIRILQPLPSQLHSHCLVRPSSHHQTETIAADIRVFDDNGLLMAEVHGLLLKRAPRASLSTARDTTKGLFYKLQWEPIPSLPSPANTPGTWLIIADANGAATRLADRLGSRGHAALTIHPDEPMPALGTLAGIVHMSSLDLDGDSAEALLSPDSPCATTLHLLQSILRDGSDHRPPVWLVTRGAQAAEAAQRNVSAMQAPLWGLGRTVALEQPTLRCTLIDLDPASDNIDLLCTEILSTSTEPQAAFRNGQRLAARLVPLPLTGTIKDAPLRISKEATYLVTGGLAGLGLRSARWLVDQGARHLVLIGRSEISSAATREVRSMECSGAHVVTVRADVSQHDQIATIIEDIRHTMPPLTGVLHCAGVLDDATLARQTWDSMTRVMAPKVGGALSLHLLTLDLKLDFFVLFSSIAGCFGAPGQANYAMANAFLDALAHQRRALGLTALSINWGAWSETGMAARLTSTDQRRLIDRGLGQMSPEQALEALGQALRTTEPQLAIVPIQWAAFFAHFAQVPALYRHFGSNITPADQSLRGSENLAAYPAAQRQQHLRALVADEAIKAIALDPSRPIDPEQSLYDIGLNSLIALDLTRSLSTRVGRPLPATMLFNYSTVSAIGHYLAGELFAEEPEARTPSANTGLLHEIESLSDEEVDRLLNAGSAR